MNSLPLPTPHNSETDQPEGQSTRTEDRRLYSRYPVDCTCRITEVDDQGNPGATWEGRMADLSRGGMGIYTRRMVHLGREIFVEVEGKAGNTKLVFGVIRQSRYSEGKGYFIGIEFREPPQTSGVRNWLLQRKQRR